MNESLTLIIIANRFFSSITFINFHSLNFTSDKGSSSLCSFGFNDSTPRSFSRVLRNTCDSLRGSKEEGFWLKSRGFTDVILSFGQNNRRMHFGSVNNLSLVSKGNTAWKYVTKQQCNKFPSVIRFLRCLPLYVCYEIMCV